MPEITEDRALIPRAVIYGTDFSPYAENAGLYAALLARHFGADLLVAHAFILSQAALEAEVEMPLKSVQRQSLKAELEKNALPLGRGLKHCVPILVEGDPREQIPALAERNAPSVIVLGTHGAGRFERGVVGSVAEEILRSTSSPSFTVGPQVPTLDSMVAPFRRVLYATDLDPKVARAAAYAVSFAEDFHSNLDVLHVIHPEDVKHPGCFNEISAQFYTVLDKLVPAKAKAFCSPRSFVEAGRAHNLILQHIEEFSADLLILGIRKASHIWMESRRSGVFQIVANATCPVMTIVG